MATTASSRMTRLVILLLVILLVVLLYGVLRVVLHRTVNRHLQASVQTIPGCSGMRYERLTLPHFSLQCQIHGARLLFEHTTQELPIHQIDVRRFRPGRQLPRELDMILHGVRLNTAQPWMNQVRHPLERLGYPSLEGDLHIKWERHGDQQAEWMIEATLQIAHAGKSTASIRLDKVNAEGVALALASPFNWLMVLPPIVLVEGRFRYEDQGLAERLLIDQARARGRRPEEMRMAILADLDRRVETETNPAVQSVWQSVTAFVRNPGRIQFHARPPRPTTLGQLLWMRQPRDIIRGLGVDMATNP